MKAIKIISKSEKGKISLVGYIEYEKKELNKKTLRQRLLKIKPSEIVNELPFTIRIYNLQITVNLLNNNPLKDYLVIEHIKHLFHINGCEFEQDYTIEEEE